MVRQSAVVPGNSPSVAFSEDGSGIALVTAGSSGKACGSRAVHAQDPLLKQPPDRQPVP